MAPRPAAELAAALASLGYAEGPPPQLSSEARKIDADVARKLHCPGCKRRGLQYQPLHRGRHYAALAVCPHCGVGEEL